MDDEDIIKAWRCEKNQYRDWNNLEMEKSVIRLYRMAEAQGKSEGKRTQIALTERATRENAANFTRLLKEREEQARADERKKCYEENRKTGAISGADEPCPQNPKHQAQRRYCVNCIIEREKEAYAKGKADTAKQYEPQLLKQVRLQERAYKKGQAELIEKLMSKDINKIASIVFWDNMKSEVKNYDVVMVFAIKAAIKAATTTAIKKASESSQVIKHAKQK